MPRENRKRGKRLNKAKQENRPQNETFNETYEPSWIRPQVVGYTEENPEAPYGYVDNDVKAYFRTVDVQIRAYQEGRESEVAEEDDKDPNEGKMRCFRANNR